MKSYYILFAILIITVQTNLNAQISTNIQLPLSINNDGAAPDASAILDIKSTNQGMLVPRMTAAQRTAIASPATGLLVFDTTTGGFWFYNGSSWTDLSAGGGGGGESTTVSDGNTVDLNLSGFNVSGEVIVDPVGTNILSSSGNGLKATEVDGSISNELQTISKSGNVVTLSDWGGSFVDEVNDADSSTTNETITSAILNGTDLEITEAGGLTTVGLGSLIPAENDPEVGNNVINFLPKWDGAALVQSSSVFEGDSGNVGIGTITPDGSAVLDIQSSDRGLRIPSLTTSQRDAIPNPAAGLLIYNTIDSCFNYYTGKEWYKDCGRSLIADEKTLTPQSVGGFSDDQGNDIATDMSGHVYVVGNFQDSALIGNTIIRSSGDSVEVFIIKYTEDGKVIWIRQGFAPQGALGFSIATDPLGNILVTGGFQDSITFGAEILTSTLPGDRDVFIVKYDTDGNVIWARSGGGSSEDIASGIATDEMGNVYITGVFADTATFGGIPLISMGDQDVFIIKYDSDGSLVWARKGGGLSDDVGFEIATDVLGNVFIIGIFMDTAYFAGTTLISSGENDVFILKYDATGTLLWGLRGGGPSEEFPGGIATDGAGNAIITGAFQDTADFESATLIAGSTGIFEVFTVKYDPSGTVLWAKSTNGPGLQVGFGTATDPTGNIFVTGIYSGNSTVFGTDTLDFLGQIDVFTLKYDTNGNVIWVQSGGGSSQEFSNSIATNISGSAFITGQYEDSITIANTTMTSNGSRDVFMVQYNFSGGQIVPATGLSSSQDYDSNPFNELITSAYLNSNDLVINDAGGTTVVDLSGLIPNDNDADPANELINFVNLNGNLLEITDAGGASTIDLSNLTFPEFDPQVGLNTTNFLSKWDGSALIQSNSLFEDAIGNLGLGTTLPRERLDVYGKIKTNGFRLCTDAGLNFVLTSDGSGNGSWQSLVDTAAIPPLAPMVQGNINTGSEPEYIAVQGDFAYVVDTDSDDLKIINVSNPDLPVQESTFPVGPHPLSVAVKGNLAFITDGGTYDLKVYDVSIPTAPVFLDSLSFTNFPISVAVQGTFAYLGGSSSNFGLKIIDISDPMSLSEVGSVQSVGIQVSVAVQDNYVYMVEDGSHVLTVIDVVNPAAPTIVGSVATGMFPASVVIQGTFAYVVDNEGFKVFDVSVPTTPVLSGSLAFAGEFLNSVKVQGKFAYIVGPGSNDLRIIDISNPSSPVLQSSIAAGIAPSSVAVEGNFAYSISNIDDKFRVFKLSGVTGIGTDFNGKLVQLIDPDPDPTNELITSVFLNGSSLEITDAGGTIPVDLSSLSGTVTDGNTVDLTLTGPDLTAEVIIDGAGGNILTSSASGLKALEVDGSTTNELITSAVLNGSSLEITDAGGTKSVDLSGIETDPQVGANTTNYIPKWNSTALVKSMSIYEDGSGDVGIGTTTPANKLDVYGNLALGITYAGSVAAPPNGAIIQGRVAIGTSNTDLARLTVNSGTSARDGIRSTVEYVGSTPLSAVYGYSVTNPGSGYGGEFVGGNVGVYALGQGGNSGATSFGVYGLATGTAGARYGLYGLATGSNYNVGVYGKAENGTTNWAGYFDGNTYNSGNLGIGTTAIANRLDVEGGAAIGSSYSGSLAAPTNGAIIQGNVGVGTSAPGSYRLAVLHGGFGLKVQHQSAGANFWEIYQGSGSPHNLLLYNSNGSVGNFNYVSGAYTATSDRKLKSNILPLTSVLPTVMQLQSKSYSYKSDPGNKEYIGFIAQDVEKLFPQLVTPPSSEGERKSSYMLNYSGFGVIAIRAIQEQQAIIEKQQEELSSLRAKVDILKSELTDMKEKQTVSIKEQTQSADIIKRLAKLEAAMSEKN